MTAAHRERDCAARYVHSWALVLRGRGWSGDEVANRFLRLAEDIRKGAHLVDPDGTRGSSTKESP